MSRPYRVLMRFIREVAVHAVDPEGECVIWPFGLNNEGYGRIEINGRSRRAHQVVLEEAGNPKPFAAAEVRHLCGNRPCVARAHLKWGTKSENQKDRYLLHGATQRGEHNRNARVTAAQVADIRRRLAAGARNRDLAAEYGLSRSAISAIKAGSTWTLPVAS